MEMLKKVLKEGRQGGGSLNEREEIREKKRTKNDRKRPRRRQGGGEVCLLGLVWQK